MAQLRLVAVFWPTPEMDTADDAVVTVADGVVIHISRKDGLEVRFLIHELAALYAFALDEVTRQEEMNVDEQHLPYPGPTAERPDLETLIAWADESICEATDGCFPVEPDGFCEHQYPSWLLYLGLI